MQVFSPTNPLFLFAMSLFMMCNKVLISTNHQYYSFPLHSRALYAGEKTANKNPFSSKFQGNRFLCFSSQFVIITAYMNRYTFYGLTHPPNFAYTNSFSRHISSLFCNWLKVIHLYLIIFHGFCSEERDKKRRSQKNSLI